MIRNAALAAAAMAASQLAEMRLTGRAPSDTPVRAIGKLLGRPVPSAAAPAVGYAAQSSLAVVAVAGARWVGWPALTAGLVLGDAAFTTALGATPPPWRWAPKDLAIDTLHKGVLAGVAVSLSRRCRRG